MARFICGTLVGFAFLIPSTIGQEIAHAQLSRIPLGHVGMVFSASISPDGESLISLGRGGEVRLTDLTQRITKVVDRGNYRAATFSADGTRLAATLGNDVVVWDLRNLQRVTVIRGIGVGPLLTLAFGTDSIAVGDGAAIVRVYDCGAWKLQRDMNDAETFQQEGPVTALTLSRDEKALLVARGGLASVLDVASGRPLGKWVIDDPVTLPQIATTMTKGGDLVLSGGAGRSVRVFSVQDGRMLRRLVGAEDSISGVAISPDSTSIAATCNDGAILLWDRATGCILSRIRCGNQPVSFPAFLRDGTVSVITEGGELIFWKRQ